MDIAFLITTYNRQQSCQRVVDSLQGLGNIVVLNDGCDYNISGCKQYFLNHHNGRLYYWDTVKTLFALRGKHKYYIMLPDDFLPEPNMVDEAVRIWNMIQDPQKTCLNLIADRQDVSCWTRFNPIDMGEYYKTGWVDMCFLCEDKFFDVINLRNRNMREVINHGAGSGVGAMISRYLLRRGYGMYQVKHGLLKPQAEHTVSEMHKNYPHKSSFRRHINPLQKIIFDTRKIKR